MMNYIIVILESEATTVHFKEYEQKLIEDFEKSKKEKWIIHEIFKFANELYVGNMTIDKFKEHVEELCKGDD